jgi:hypothetical protein
MLNNCNLWKQINFSCLYKRTFQYATQGCMWIQTLGMLFDPCHRRSYFFYYIII